MPTPFTLQFKADIWSTSTEQKLQILEQILMLFNPSLEIQTTDNFVDWTSLSVVDLEDLSFSSRQIPVGTNDVIDVATISLTTPIWISPPAKVKKLGIVTSLISNIFGGIGEPIPNYIDGFGNDIASGDTIASDHLFKNSTYITNYNISVSGTDVKITSKSNSSTLTWTQVFDLYPGKYQAGLAKIYLTQPDGSEVVGYGSINLLDDTILTVSNWDIDTFPTNDILSSDFRSQGSWGSFDAIIDPQKTGPTNIVPGTRYLIINGIGGGIRETLIANTTVWIIETNVEFKIVDYFKIFVNNIEVDAISEDRNGILCIKPTDPILANSVVTYELYVNEDGPDAWKNADGSDFIAEVNDIIEWTGEKWYVLFSAKNAKDQLIYQTNLYTLTQYKWDGIMWTRSFEGDYRRGQWKIEL